MQPGPTFKCLLCDTVGIGEPVVLTQAGWRAFQKNGEWGDICPLCRISTHDNEITERIKLPTTPTTPKKPAPETD